uniref:Uncharacterized protein n=1 Tax=Oryza barthii TaxID=65489 RepID=A0A0D3HUN6_9ORYZ
MSLKLFRSRVFDEASLSWLRSLLQRVFITLIWLLWGRVGAALLGRRSLATMTHCNLFIELLMLAEWFLGSLG